MSLNVTPHARSRDDRAGDPLDGLVNLFDLAIVLAVAFLLAALSSLKLQDLLTSRNLTIVRDPGSPTQSVIVRQGDTVRVLNLSKEHVAGTGTPVGTVYRLQDGRLVYVQGK
jgi:hypothetical protein